jgi:hypothetical protein
MLSREALASGKSVLWFKNGFEILHLATNVF